MPTFDSLLEHLARGTAPASPRTTSRIISSERLDRYTRFAMDALASGEDAPPTRHAEREHAAPDYAAGRKSGLTEGFQRGFEAGVAHAHADREAHEKAAGGALAARIETLVADLGERLQALEREAADEVVALAIEIARHAVRTTIALRPETIVPVVQEALASIVDDSVRMHLHLNPADAALVRDELGTRLANTNCEIVVDERVEAGGCRIETPRASVDATLGTRWRRTLAALGHPDSEGARA
ncbi:MAG: FliH/SctL family protein [Burkholderiaceae bacterium]|nr:FliH/SctL family protein [Burkholderiaceae bacterium]